MIAGMDWRVLAQVEPDSPIGIITSGGLAMVESSRALVLSTTLRELAAALAPLIMEEAVKAEVAVLAVQPGEIAVIRSRDYLPESVTKHLMDWWDKHMPGAPMMILDGGAELTTVAKGDAA